MKDIKRPRGRPPTGKRQFNCRLPDQLFRRLKREAAEARLPLTEIITARLEQSLDREALLADVRAAIANGEADKPFVREYGPRVETLCKVIAAGQGTRRQ